MRIDNLTGLRAFAALWVVLLHIRYGDAALAYGPLAYFFHIGATGVTFFFLLSGFIMAHVHQEDFDTSLEPRSIVRYLWLRLARIYPVHFVLLLIYASGTWGIAQYDNPTSFKLNLLLMQSWGLFGIDGINWNQPAWSISSEWFCYLLFPALAFISGKFRYKWMLAVPLIVGCLFFYPWYMNFNLGFKHMASPISTFIVFLVGYGVRLLVPYLGGSVKVWNDILMLVLGYLLFTLFMKSMDIYNVIPLSAMLVLALYKASPNFIFANRVSLYLGEISYAMYLSHIMTFTYLRIQFGGKPLPLWIEIPVVIAVAAVLYHLVEKPARNVLRSFIPATRESHATAGALDRP